MRICIFCGSGFGKRADYTEAAQTLVKTLAAQNIGLVYGGAAIGLMGLIADTMLEAGGEVIGVIPQALKDREIAHPNLSALHVVDSMHERKAKMAELSDAFIAIPGGAGTLEEIAEVWTWAKLGIHHKPCGFLNVAGYYDQLFAFLTHMVDEQFIQAKYHDMLCIAESPSALLDKFAHYVPPQTPLSPSDAAGLTTSPPPSNIPPSNIVDVIAWICIKEKRLLCARSQGKDVFYLPGGKREPGESDWDGLHREVQEEVGVALIKETFETVITIEEIAHGYARPTQVIMKCFQAGYTGAIAPASEIEQLAWLQYADKAQCAPATQRVIEHLHAQHLID